MKHFINAGRAVCILMVILGLFVAVQAKPDVEDKNPDAEDKKADQKTDKVEKTAEAKKAPEVERTPQEIWRDNLYKAYLKADWPTFDRLAKKSHKNMRKLKSKDKRTIKYIRGAARVHRPKWWKNCRSTCNKSFKVKIWKKKFVANYVPTGMLGMQGVFIDPDDGKLKVVVTWRPTYVDSRKKFTNEAMEDAYGMWVYGAEKHGFKMGTMAETVAWHELGHNYVSISLPQAHVIRLYNNYESLYTHLQELYADVTALYHASTPSRLFTLMFRGDGLRNYDEMECHTRAAHAIGAIILSKVLEQPEKWPSLHFPGKIPEEDVERKTIIYMYRHIDPNWTVQEDMTFRKFIEKWIRSKGDAALRSKGKLTLPNKKIFWIMASDDRDEQPKRDAWVKKKLEALIKSGRADDPEIVKKDTEEDGVSKYMSRSLLKKLREAKEESEKKKAEKKKAEKKKAEKKEPDAEKDED